MSSISDQPSIVKEYKVVCVEKTNPPEGVENGTWYRYVIECGNSTIVGNRRGTLQQVTSHADDFVEGLNTRPRIPGRSMWAPRQKKK
ncbi:MAG: hypothetical protein GY807_02035 [Gammaproteobacteria bacterium]|nr:hypothetical protein [Gammaproteobacteria bacterium]